MVAKAFPHMFHDARRFAWPFRVVCCVSSKAVFFTRLLCRMKLTPNLAKPFANTYNIAQHPRVGTFVWGEKVAKASRLSPRLCKK